MLRKLIIVYVKVNSLYQMYEIVNTRLTPLDVLLNFVTTSLVKN